MQFTSNAGSLREKLNLVAITQATARKIFLAENTALKLNAYSNNNHRHIWNHPINDKKRIWRVSSFNASITADSAKFKEYLRMSPITFDHLLRLIENDLTKNTKNYKKPRSPEERLVVNIRLVK